MEKKLKVVSLFSGIGAFEKALENLKIKYELLAFSEIDKGAINSYCAIHNVDKNLNLGDITQIDLDKFNGLEVDLLTHGSPCQDFSIIGKGAGGDEGCNTRSSLMWNSVEIIKRCKPKVVIWENVKNVLSKKNRHNFEKYLDTLENIGYTNYYKVLNAKDFNIPQNRERIFVVSILNNKIDFIFPHGEEYKGTIFDILETDEENIKNKYQPKERFFLEFKKKDILKKSEEVFDGKLGEKLVGDFRYDEGIRIRKNGKAPTLTCKAPSNFIGQPIIFEKKNDKMTARNLTEKEVFRLMGFSDDDYYKAEEANPRKFNHVNNTIYKQAGNSIVVNILMAIFKELYLSSKEVK